MRIPIRLYGGIAWEKREDDTALKTAHRVEPAITHFAISGAPITCEKYGHGHINCTYQVKTDDGHAYILQRINRYVFADPKAVMENVGAVTQYLRERAEDPHEVLNFIPADTGVYYHIDEAGEYWRCYEFADGICLEAPESDTDFYESAIAFGRFQEMLREFPAETLHETIPLFHNTTNRYRIFRKALQDDLAGRAAGVPDDIRFALDREQEAGTPCSLLDSGELPLRVTHNDTKLNNVLLDPQTGCAKCVLDLDTVMPGLSAYDFGDGVRFGASSAAEDEKDLDQVWLKLDMYQAFLEGYLDACGHALTPKEIEVLPLGAKIITAELAMRFLKDYLDGDVYFKIDYPTQNLDRCRTQLKLVADMEAKWPEMQRILHETAAVRCAQPTTPQ